MSVQAGVREWALQIIRERSGAYETLRARAAAHWKHGKRIHKLRTQSRRLRAALEDLCDTTPQAAGMLDTCKAIAEVTAEARDTVVMIERLERYRRCALAAERAEINRLCDELWKRNAAGLKKAKRAVKNCRVDVNA